jgi:hypothetical protein
VQQSAHAVLHDCVAGMSNQPLATDLDNVTHCETIM